MRIGIALSLVLVLSGLATADDKDDIAKAAKKTAESESYAFKMVTEIEGSPMPIDPIEFAGKFQKDVATSISGSIPIPMQGGSQDIEIYKKGDKVVTKNQNGEWQLAGAGGRGGRGGMGMGQLTRNLKAPHEELADVDKKFEEIKKKDAKETADGKECTVYEGKLTEDAAKDILPGGMGRMLAGMGEIAGTAKVLIDADGVIRKYVFVSEIKASIQGNELEITTTRSVSLTDIGSTKLEVPEEVKKLLEEKKEEPKKEEKKQDE